MKQGNDFMVDMLDFDLPEARQDVLWRAYAPTAAEMVNGDVLLTVPQWQKDVTMPLDHIPVYVRCGAQIPVYPEPVATTADMDLDKTVTVVFDENYRGIGKSVLGEVTGLE